MTALIPKLAELMTERGRRLLLLGRRRMGKTSLVKNAACRARATLLYCDMLTVAGMGEVNRRLLAMAPEGCGEGLAQALQIAARHLPDVAVVDGKIALTEDLRTEDGNVILEGVLNFLNEHAGARDEAWTVCLDEFQELYRLGGPRIDWRLRGLMQEHRHLNYILVVADYRVIDRLAGPKAPFYKQLQQMEVGPIDPDRLARWIERKAKAAGRSDFPYGAQIVAAAGPCTGDIVRLAGAVLDFTVGGTPKDVVERAFDFLVLHDLSDGFVQHWRSFSINQRLVLRAVAAGKPPAASVTLRAYGLRAASTASAAVAVLVGRQVLVRMETGVIFDDPFFRRWVVLHAP